MHTLQRLHFWVGVVGLVAFLASGQYMHHLLDHLEGMADGPRMLWRSNHIYLLLTASINLMAGLYAPPGRARGIQVLISLLLLSAPFFIAYGFWFEPGAPDLQRPYSRLGLYAVFAASVLAVVFRPGRDR